MASLRAPGRTGNKVASGLEVAQLDVSDVAALEQVGEGVERSAAAAALCEDGGSGLFPDLRHLHELLFCEMRVVQAAHFLTFFGAARGLRRCTPAVSCVDAGKRVPVKSEVGFSGSVTETPLPLL